MSPRAPRAAERGFTLIEMMVVIAIAAVVLVLAAPSFREYILMQRLKSINAQIVTDLAFARSEAISRGTDVRFKVTPWDATTQMSCYVIFTVDTLAIPRSVNQRDACNCTQTPGSVCTAGAQEVRTVQVPGSLQVYVGTDNQRTIGSQMIFDARTGGMTATNVDGGIDPLTQYNVHACIDPARKLRNEVAVSGRVSVCAPGSSTMQGRRCVNPNVTLQPTAPCV